MIREKEITTDQTKHVATGRIVSVQEERFRLMTDDGETLLLTLARFSHVSPHDLHRWQETSARLAVTYEGSPDLVSGVARSINPL